MVIYPVKNLSNKYLSIYYVASACPGAKTARMYSVCLHVTHHLPGETGKYSYRAIKGKTISAPLQPHTGTYTQTGTCIHRYTCF